MHVVMVNHGYRPLPPEPGDSPALVIDQLAVALTRRGVRVTAIGGPAPTRPMTYETVELAPSRAARWGGTSVGEVVFGLHARRPIRPLRPDVIHHHASTPAAVGSRPRGIPTVFSYAAPVGATGRATTWGALSPLSELVERVACRRSDHVVAVSRFTEGFLRTRYHVPTGRLSVIPNGVDTSLFAPGADEPTDRTIACVARLSPYKDQATLVAALGQPELAGAGVRLVLVGPPDDAAYAASLRRLAGELGVQDRLEIAGPMDFSRLPDLYRSAAVVAAPSRAEGMPLALLEAMSCGRPVVASAIPQHLEVGQDAGVTFVPPGDAAAMAKAIAGLLEDAGARGRAGRAARRTAVERYSWDAVAERLERLYKDLVA
jgi:glycosyltransferase involved in cell wall biosynthesis